MGRKRQLEPLSAETVSAVSSELLERSLDAVRRSLSKIHSKLPKEIEVVHKLRVATRRAAATLELIEPTLSAKQMLRWKSRLREVRRVAGKARDLDVLLSSESATKSKKTVRRLAQQRLQAQPALHAIAVRWRAGTKWNRQAKRLVKRLAESQSFAAVAWPGFAQHRLAAQLDRFERASRRSHESDDRLHRFRIAGKHLRYLLEQVIATQGCHDQPAAHQELVELQVLLGKLNDERVAAEKLSDKKAKRIPKVAEDPSAARSNERIEWETEWPIKRIDKLIKGLRAALRVK